MYLLYDADIGRALQAQENFSIRGPAGIDTEERQEAVVLAHAAGDRAKRMLDGAEAAAAEFHRYYGRASAAVHRVIALLQAIEWRHPETQRLRLLRNA
jgi:hypothetical protein